MKASDLDKVKTLLEDLAMARIQQQEYDKLPPSASNLLMRIDYKKDSIVPHHRDQCWTLRLNPEKDLPTTSQAFYDLIRSTLRWRVECLETSLRRLGVDPTL